MGKHSQLSVLQPEQDGMQTDFCEIWYEFHWIAGQILRFGVAH